MTGGGGAATVATGGGGVASAKTGGGGLGSGGGGLPTMDGGGGAGEGCDIRKSTRDIGNAERNCQHLQTGIRPSAH